MASAASSSRPVVLVVEDDPFLRFHAVDLIEAAGFSAVEAANADDAIAVLVARTDIRVVFTDIDMPGSMDGLKLAIAIRDRWPPVEVLLTSGHSRPREDELPIRGRFLPKPYQDGHLLSALRAFLA